MDKDLKRLVTLIVIRLGVVVLIGLGFLIWIGNT
jgi:hypothetical protein